MVYAVRRWLRSKAVAGPHGVQRDIVRPDFEARVQVQAGHYGPQYERATRWVNYGAQVREVMECSPRTVLEVGTGNGTVTAILRSRGLAVTTFDVDPSLRPDIVGSVHELTKYVPPSSFDVVLCAEVLEHLPFELLGECSEQLAAAARHYVIIGLPCFPRPRWEVTLQVQLPRFRLRPMSLTATLLPEWPGPGPEHYWEVDYRPYTMDAVRTSMAHALSITSVCRDPHDPGHVVLTCRRAGGT